MPAIVRPMKIRRSISTPMIHFFCREDLHSHWFTWQTKSELGEKNLTMHLLGLVWLESQSMLALCLASLCQAVFEKFV